MENISWTDRVRNEEVFHRVKDERNILHTVKSRIGHNWRRNCLLKHVIEGKIEGRRGKQLPDGLKEKRGYCKLQDVLGRTVWRNDRGRTVDLS
jgi:hypothetical protein